MLRLLRQIRELPVAFVLRRGGGWVLRRIRETPDRIRDRGRRTYDDAAALPPIARRLEPPPLELVRRHDEVARRLAGRAREHVFDLLGSGPVRVRHGVACRGLEGARYESGPAVRPDRTGDWLKGRITAPNLDEARRIWSLVDDGYVPIDWHLDFKSGHRWSETTWYRDVLLGHLPGVDVKVPWELARMQHLPQLAWAYALDGDPAHARELRNQILDFIATNPPRFGVNWFSTMDVAIRVANWLVAFDLLRAFGASFDRDFEAVLARSVGEHGAHVADHLTGDWATRGNHYLGDLAGLAVVAAYVEPTERSRRWRDLAGRGLVAEVEHQFGADGTNFEGSTSYHRLSAELALYPSALLGSVEPAAFPEAHWQRLRRMADFTVDCTKPSGRVVQIGDNDSGRFLRLTAREPEESLDHAALIAAVDGLRGLGEPRPIAAPFVLEHWLTRALASSRAGGESERPPKASEIRVGGAADWSSRADAEKRAAHRVVWRFDVDVASLREGLTLAGYPDFGLWIFRSPRLFLAVRCGSNPRQVVGAHLHNDQLGVELTIDGRDLVADPGSYLYTPSPSLRNAYRSVAAHFAPRVSGREPADISARLFRAKPVAGVETLYFGAEGFAGRHGGFGADVFRRVEVLDRAVVVTDWSSLPLATEVEPPPFSPGYGLAIPEKPRYQAITASPQKR